MTNSPPLNEPFAVGKTASIYRWDDDHVLKLYVDSFPVEYAQHEASMTQAVYDLGLPVPQVGEIVEINGRFGLLIEQIEGPSLLEAWLQAPNQSEPLAELLAQLHQQIHSLSAPPLDILPQQREWVTNNIQDAADLDSTVQQEALSYLSQLEDGQTLCHGDFHPGNILFTAAGKPVIIDWFSAVVGHPLADVAQTTFILTAAPLPAPLDTVLTPAARQTFSDVYTKCMLAGQPQEQESLKQWQTVVKAAASGLFT